jgi:hypothetical protein
MKKFILSLIVFGLISFTISAQEVWTGTTSTDWTVDTNWQDGSSPNNFAGSGITIPNVANDPVVTGGSVVVVGAISIASGATLTISGGYINHPSGALDNDGTVIINSSGAYLQSAAVTGTGTFQYVRNLATSNWYVIASPLAGQDIDTFVTNSSLETSGSNSAFGTYRTLQNDYTYYTTGSSGTGNFTPGKGHTVSLSGSSGDLTFTGSNPSTSNITYTLNYTGNRYNLLGNAWPSYLKTPSFLSDNTAKLESQTIWTWNAANSSWTTLVGNDGRYIAPCQGFFVEAKSGGSGDVTFQESYQETSGTGFQGPEVNLAEVQLTLKNSTTFREAKIYYVAGTTTGFDNGWDGKIFGGQNNDFAIYTKALTFEINRDYDLGVQTVPSIDYSIPVGINAEPGTDITLSAISENLPEGINIYLEDTETDTLTLLDGTSEYSISLPDGSAGIGRFYIHTVANELEIGENNLDSIIIYKSQDNNLQISGLQAGTANLKVYNMLGKLVLETSFEADRTNTISVHSLQQGIYIVHLETAQGTLIKKIGL